MLTAGMPAQGVPPQPQPPQPQEQEQGQQPQQPQPQGDPRLQALQGKVVREIQVVRFDDVGHQQPVAEALADRVLRSLRTRVGQPLDVAKVSEDVAMLARERRLNVSCVATPDGDQLTVVFAIRSEDRVYESVEFGGLHHFTRADIDNLLGLHLDRQVTSAEALAMRNVLLARYQRDGYAWCSVDLQESAPDTELAPDWPRKKLTFRIDEGPRVTVREVHFRGNESFPGDPPMGLLNPGDYLTRSSHIQSKGAWALANGDPYSSEIVEEDLDRLRLFYRSRGFLDASVELADVVPTADHSTVDLDILVVEGVRYRIKEVRVEPVDSHGQPLPAGQSLYPPEQVEKVLRVAPGQFYDRDMVRRDLREIRDFYGKRGHPPDLDQQIPEAFSVVDGWPLESYSGEGEVTLIYRLHEGTPKTLREVVIRGNTSTRDKVIRRKIFALPGERLDMTEVDKSVRSLNQLRYFQDPVTLAGPRVELLPVEGDPDAVAMAVDVKEGQTSEFRWGIGISTGAGANANIEFKKRNFDLWNPPSSLNPATMFGEIFDSKAFHGGGQTLDLFLAPGTQISQFGLVFVEPDTFGDYFDTIESRFSARRRIRRWREGYTTDTLGVDGGLSRNFTDTFAAGISMREESVHTGSLAADAPTLAYDARGTTELRGARLTLRYHDLDDPVRPTDGVELAAAGEVVGGILGGQESFTKFTAWGHYYLPLYENVSGHRWVLHAESFFGTAHAFGQSDDVFLTERFYMGAVNLRGFDYRGAGPSQFGRAIGGEAMLTSSLELSFPLIATRSERQIQDRELIRGLVFTDFGLDGLALHDPTFYAQPRLSVGFGIRIEVPVLEIPIALDLGWPLLYEETDDRGQLYFSISR